jgi:hypothetical protein
MPKVYNKHYDDAPPEAVYIGRGSRWGNIFVIGQDGDRNEVCNKFEKSITPEYKEIIKKQLRGKDLVCFCAPSRCHGDTLLKIANEEKDV